ncbi:MAG: RNA 2',3'-cyclic phosphodiesterase [Chloroflexota bacterium]
MARNLSKEPAAELRLFLAIEAPTEIQNELAAVQDELRQYQDILKLVRPDMMHLTVRFLGNVPAARLPDVEQAAQAVAVSARPFGLHVGYLGTFPTGKPARVVWAGVLHDAGLEALRKLFQALEAQLEQRGFQRETRPLSPHLTLARVRQTVPAGKARLLTSVVERLAVSHPLCGRFDVSELTVMQSDNGPRGPRYTPLARLSLPSTE